MKLRTLLGATGAATVLALTAGGVAYASTNSTGSTASTASTTAATPTSRPAHGHPWLRHEVRVVLRHTVHADLIVRTRHGYENLELDRGTLTSDAGNVLTITRPDGPSVTATVTAKTRFFGLPEAKLATGDKVLLVQTGGDALVVAARKPS